MEVVPVVNNELFLTMSDAEPPADWPTVSIKLPFCVMLEPAPSTVTTAVVVVPPNQERNRLLVVKSAPDRTLTVPVVPAVPPERLMPPGNEPVALLLKLT